MTLIRDEEHAAKGADQLEREADGDMRRLAEAKAVAGPEHDEPTSSSNTTTAAAVNAEVEHA